MPNHSLLKGTQDHPQTQKSQSLTRFPSMSGPLQCTTDTTMVCARSLASHRAAGETEVPGSTPWQAEDHFYPSCRGTGDKAACVLPETLTLGDVRGWVALEWQ